MRRFEVITDGEHLAPVIELPARTPRTPRPRRAAGFSMKVKLETRARAGGHDRDIDEARCESCGVWLGRYGGQIQHRAARGMGGSTSLMTNSIQNAVLLCGTPFDGCHGLCERRQDERMNILGFWLRHGEHPACTPIVLHGRLGHGLKVWLTPTGRYSHTPPAGGAA